jgi:anti-sigma factor RsiW
MNCEKIREQIPECLGGRLDKAAREKLVEHLETCASCRTEVAELNAVWRALESMKAADAEPAMKLRFMEVLEAYKAGAGQATEIPKASPRSGWFVPMHPVWQMALAASLLVGGVFVGRYESRPQPAAPNPEVAQLKGEIDSLRQLVALSMLQQQSPSARLRGVSYSEAMSQPDRQVEEALLSAVNHDSNVNVRLSAVDALQKFAGSPGVIGAMVQAIPVQDSPLVQIALIDMLVQLNAKAETSALVQISKDGQMDEAVRQRAAWAVQKLSGQKEASK